MSADVRADLELARARLGYELGLPHDHVALGFIDRLEQELDERERDEQEAAELADEAAEAAEPGEDDLP